MDGEQPASETPEVDLGIVPDSEAINNWATYYKAYQLVWNCKWKESEQLLKPKLQTDPWSGYLYFYVCCQSSWILCKNHFRWLFGELSELIPKNILNKPTCVVTDYNHLLKMHNQLQVQLKASQKPRKKLNILSLLL